MMKPEKWSSSSTCTRSRESMSSVIEWHAVTSLQVTTALASVRR